MYQTKWRMMWAKIYWSGVYNELTKVVDPLKDLLKDLIIKYNDFFEENEQLYVPPKSDMVHSNTSNMHRNSVKQVTKCNTSGYCRIDKRARSNCRK